MTSNTSFRIASNVNTHGIRFAVDAEIARWLRLGRSQQAAIGAGLASVSAVLRQMRVIK